MGRGDIKTKRGKIFAGSFGKTRPAKVATNTVAASSAPKAEKTEKVAKAPKKAAKKAE